MQELEKTFSTFDLSLATVLVALGFPVESLNMQNRNKVKFSFKRKNGLDEVIQGYWAKTLQIEPQILFANLKSIKNRLYSS